MKNKKFKNILVTGGAGFIGSFLVDELIKKGYKVRILDNLEDQVHHGRKPKYLNLLLRNKSVQFIKGDVRNYEIFKKVLQGIDAVFHLAAAVGVAQSNYQIKKYSDTNIGGMANLLDILVNTKHNIKKIVTISSMTGYGEGNYRCKKCGIVRPPLRDEIQLRKKDWNLYCPNCAKIVQPIPTDETALDFPNSIYGLTKVVQQDMLFLIGKIYNIPVVVLRGFNVYGPRQSLSNPYTGVSAIFISRLKNNKACVVYEDGLQSRDFISVHDMVEAFVLALENDRANYQIFNIGFGKGTAILELAKILENLLGKSYLISLNNEFRKNDIRHCFSDISKAKKILGWKPKINLEQGLAELIEWSKKEKSNDKFKSAEKELKDKGILN